MTSEVGANGRRSILSSVDYITRRLPYPAILPSYSYYRSAKLRWRKSAISPIIT